MVKAQSQEWIRKFLSETPPFSILTTEELEILSTKGKHHTFPAETLVFKQDANSLQELFLVISGLAEIYVGSNGYHYLAGYRRERDFFGETAIFSNKAYPASVKAVTPLSCLRIDAVDLKNLLERNAIFASSFSQLIMEHLHTLFHEIALEQKSLKTIESQVAIKRASEMMRAPVITCSPSEPCSMLARRMNQHHISSLVVTDASGQAKGLVTEHDLIQKIVAHNMLPDTHTAEDIADQDPLYIFPDLFYYQILLSMIRNKAKHAIVIENNCPIGIITMRDLLQSRNTDLISIQQSLDKRNSLSSLPPIAAQIDQILHGLFMEKAPIPEILDIITAFYDRLTHHIIEIAMEQLYPNFGPPPVKFCWLTLGSSGRREQFTRSDQDHALIYENIIDLNLKGKAESYFARLTDLIVEGLVQCGFAKCPGNVMAVNPQWRGDENYWYSHLSTWIKQPEKGNIRLLTIFLDFRPIYGDSSLADRLRSFTLHALTDHPLVYRFLAQDACQGRIPIRLFGYLIGEHTKMHRNEIDLKKSVTVFIVDCIRLSAILKGTKTTNTLERLQILRKHHTYSKEFVESIDNAYQSIMYFRIRDSISKMKQGGESDNYLNLKDLSKSEREVLKHALKTVEKLITLTRETFLL